MLLLGALLILLFFPKRIKQQKCVKNFIKRHFCTSLTLKNPHSEEKDKGRRSRGRKEGRKGRAKLRSKEREGGNEPDEEKAIGEGEEQR